jgi:hypothetical protein
LLAEQFPQEEGDSHSTASTPPPNTQCSLAKAWPFDEERAIFKAVG